MGTLGQLSWLSQEFPGTWFVGSSSLDAWNYPFLSLCARLGTDSDLGISLPREGSLAEALKDSHEGAVPSQIFVCNVS